MPPPAANKPLSEQKKRILRDWIAAGAEYRTHWAFAPPEKSPPPAVHRSELTRNTIDRFILARLEAEGEGLTPAPEADRYTLIRRVYLDLVGLPPTPAEADASSHDPAPTPMNGWSIGCWPRRIMASAGRGAGSTWPATPTPTATKKTGRGRSGPIATGSSTRSTRTCRSTSSPSSNSPATCCPARRSPSAVATGFHRNTMLNEEGGIDPLEFRFYAMVDRVQRYRHGLARADPRLRPVPHAQVRSDPAPRLLPVDGAS